MKFKKFLPVLGLVAFCMAAYLLYRALSQYNAEEIVESLFAVSPPQLAFGMLFVAGSYFSHTIFDLLASRYVGAKLSYRRVALASFSAISIGHTLGLAAVSSGAIRYRFYSRWGIASADIAKIILFCAMTVGLGLSTLGGLALLLQPEVAAKILSLSQAAAIVVGTACVALSVLYVSLAAVLRPALTQWDHNASAQAGPSANRHRHDQLLFRRRGATPDAALHH
jgi:glycosyltransferase 2 family protein